jgi:hypothetical protein
MRIRNTCLVFQSKKGALFISGGGTFFSERNELGTKLKYVDRNE